MVGHGFRRSGDIAVLNAIYDQQMFIIGSA